MSQPGPMGWGLLSESESSLMAREKRAFDALANLAPQNVMRHKAQEPKNEALLARVRDRVKAAGWDSGMILPFLFAEVTKIQPAWLRQLIGSCFPAGVLVKMADGSSKPIEDVAVGDFVISHTGKAQRVTNVFQRNYTGEMHKVSVFGHPYELEATADHKFATVPWKGWRYDRKTADLENIEWVRAENLESGQDRVIVANNVSGKLLAIKSIDMLELVGSEFRTTEEVKTGSCDLYSRPTAAKQGLLEYEKATGESLNGRIIGKCTSTKNAIIRHVAVTPSFARLLGLYAAEGGTDHCRVTFTFNVNERDTLAKETQDLIRGCFGVESLLIVEAERGRCTVRVNNKILQKVFQRLFGGGVLDKQVPLFLFSQPQEIKIAFLAGWMSGDGSFQVNKQGFRRAVGVSASKSLARGMYEIALSCGFMLSCRARKARKQSKEAFEVGFSGNDYDSLKTCVVKETKTCKFHKFGIARKVASIAKRVVELLPVYDFEVEEDHSFIANGLVVHNCVASGDMRTTAYRMVAEVFVFHDTEELPGTKLSGTDSLAFYAPFNYRAGRKLAGINGNSDGSLCLPHIRGKMQFGHLPCNTPGLSADAFPEPQRESDYKRWGANDTLLNQYASAAAPYKLLESEPVKSVNDIHTLICEHLKPANICSMWGFKTTGKALGKDPTGKTIRQWSRSGQWAHNMSVVGHVSKSGTDYVIIENSWGGYHDGSTCFAVEASEMDRWLKQAECQSVGEIDLTDSGPAIDWGMV